MGAFFFLEKSLKIVGLFNDLQGIYIENVKIDGIEAGAGHFAFFPFSENVDINE